MIRKALLFGFGLLILPFVLLMGGAGALISSMRRRGDDLDAESDAACESRLEDADSEPSEHDDRLRYGLMDLSPTMRAREVQNAVQRLAGGGFAR